MAAKAVKVAKAVKAATLCRIPLPAGRTMANSSECRYHAAVPEGPPMPDDTRPAPAHRPPLTSIAAQARPALCSPAGPGYEHLGEVGRSIPVGSRNVLSGWQLIIRPEFLTSFRSTPRYGGVQGNLWDGQQSGSHAPRKAFGDKVANGPAAAGLRNCRVR
jgi:hypothetical protein